MKGFARFRRALAFGRHIPPGKLFRRIALTARRRLRDRFGWHGPAAAASPATAAAPPLPLFAARDGHLTPGTGSLSFTFLGQTLAMPGAVDWRAPGEGPAHQLWRMNLHYMEYLEAVDDRLFAELVLQWIAANPPNRPGVWKDSWNSYALSLRVVVWMQQMARRGASLPLAARAAIDVSLASQLRFLEHNLETDLGGNHLVKNIKALIWASGTFTGPESQRWRGMATNLLRAALAEQVLGDGMHYERSPSYHCQVFADLLECRHVLGAAALDGELDRALLAMAQVTADLAHPDGLVAQFNDAGLAMAYAPGECLDVFERLLGKRPQPREVFGLPQAGYFGLRTGSTYLVADCGRIAPDDLPAHGHGDILSFEWSVNGQRIIVDPGVFEYVAGEKRARSRSASAHNTLCFAGADQAGFFGAFRCGRRPDVSVHRFEPGPASFGLEGSHDGFAILPGKPRHSRRFEASATRLLIQDSISGQPDRPAALHFLFHPDVSVEQHGNSVTLACGDTIMQMTSTLPIAIDKSTWWPDMGQELLTSCARIEIDCGIAAVLTTFDLSDRDSAATGRLRETG